MAPASIHQAIHGYRDGHRLLSISCPLNAEAMRALLVLSDMSGPSMQPGFDEYLTGYPLPGSEFFVFAKTWYAQEMQRPGCVWTHSLLIPRLQVPNVTTFRLLKLLRRPQLEGIEKTAATPIVLGGETYDCSSEGGFEDRSVAAALIAAVLGQPRSVIVSVDSAAQLEPVVLRLWDELWPAMKARFSFCTGAIIPRTVAGALMDIEVVPRTVPSSQFRRNSISAHFLDLRTLPEHDAWVDTLLDYVDRGDTSFRSWMEAVAGADASRASVPSLVPIFGQWHATNWSERDVLERVLGASGLESITRERLLEMVFDRSGNEGGPARRRELIQYLCSHRDAGPNSMVSLLVGQTRRLFDESRVEGGALILSLFSAELTEFGEHVLRSAVRLLMPDDLETFTDRQAHFLPTIVVENPALAASPILWKRIGAQTPELLSQLTAAGLGDKERGSIVDAILTSDGVVPVDSLIRFGGRAAIFRALAALASSHIPFSWQWRAALSAQPDAILDWLEGPPSPTPRELDLVTKFLSPKVDPPRFARVWQAGIVIGAGTVSPRIAAFGLALAFAEGDARSALLAACFQPTFDAAANSQLEYEEWDWLRDLAPPISWWRDWDKCERLSAALSRLIEKQRVSLETLFRIACSRQAIRKVAGILHDNRDTRHYLRYLRNAAEASSCIGTREQRAALLEDG